MDLYNPSLSEDSMRQNRTNNELECKCECENGHTCKVCRSDLVILLVNVGVPLRIARKFVQLEVGTVGAI